MPTFRAEFYGRLKGAIGLSYSIVDIVEAPDKAAARLKLYDNYESVLQDVITEENLNETDRHVLEKSTYA